MLCSTCDAPQVSGTTHCSACGTPLAQSLTLRALGAEAAGVSASLPEGMTLQNGIFTIEGVLGRGGFGITYRGRDGQLGRTVAIKEFFPSGCIREGAAVRPLSDVSLEDYASARRHFLDEAQVLARFRHPGIVQVFTVFEENNTAYTVMELLQGQTLAALLEKAELGLGQERSLSIIGKIAPALAAVHDKGLLHRDIKPDNIMLALDEETLSERVVLIDFGSARELGGGQTRGQSIVLTPGYAPLEQYAGQTRRGAYSDVYALAATLYHMLTGHVPTAAGDRAVGVPLQPVHCLNPQVDKAVADAVHRAMETEIARRPQSVREFMAALSVRSDSEDKYSVVGERAADTLTGPAFGSDYLYNRYLETLMAPGDAAAATLSLGHSTKSVTKPIGSILRSVALSQPVEPERPAPTFKQTLTTRLREKPLRETILPDEGEYQVREREHRFLPATIVEWGIILALMGLASISLLFTIRGTILDLIRFVLLKNW